MAAPPADSPISQLPPAHVEALAAIGTLRRYPKHSMVMQEGDRGDELYVVVTGRVRLYIGDADGREIELGTRGPGQHFGELALDGGTRVTNVMTKEATQLACIARADLARYLGSHPDAAFALIVLLTGRIRDLTTRVGRLGLKGTVQRLVLALRSRGTRTDTGWRIVPAPTQATLSREIGASRPSVSRALARLRKTGRLRDIDGGYELVDPVGSD
jgi:CRP/FNR family cyclic AMP-dependent transcriptional regulator